MYNKYLVLIQTCSRTIVDLKINPIGIKIVSYVNILHVFLFTRKICTLFYGLRKIVCISQFCPMSSQILSYINIFDINGKLLAQATDVKYVVSNV